MNIIYYCESSFVNAKFTDLFVRLIIIACVNDFHTRYAQCCRSERKINSLRQAHNK